MYSIVVGEAEARAVGSKNQGGKNQARFRLNTTDPMQQQNISPCGQQQKKQPTKRKGCRNNFEGVNSYKNYNTLQL